MNKKIYLIGLLLYSLFLGNNLNAQQTVTSPDESISISFSLNSDDQPFFSIFKNKEQLLANSPLGLVTSEADFSSGLTLVSEDAVKPVSDSYEMVNAKKRQIVYKANRVVYHLKTKEGRLIDVIFQLSNDGIGFRYFLPGSGKTTVKKEITAYNFLPATRGWLQPMASSKSGWEQTNPSYEENYLQDNQYHHEYVP